MLHKSSVASLESKPEGRVGGSAKSKPKGRIDGGVGDDGGGIKSWIFVVELRIFPVEKWRSVWRSWQKESPECWRKVLSPKRNSAEYRVSSTEKKKDREKKTEDWASDKQASRSAIGWRWLKRGLKIVKIFMCSIVELIPVNVEFESANLRGVMAIILNFHYSRITSWRKCSPRSAKSR
jgi:hypothetical protein